MRLSVGSRLYGLVGCFAIGMIAMASFLIVQNADTSREQRGQELKSLVETAIGITSGFEKLSKSGALTEEQAKTQAMAAIKSMRYRGSEYFWINDYDNVMIMHSVKPSLNEKNLSNLQDAHGKYIFQEFVREVKMNGSGFVEYLWPKPGSNDAVEKLSYVAGFKKWNWIIGSGVYLDDLNAQLTSKAIVALLVGGLILAGIMLLAFFNIRGVVGPINSLRNDMLSLSEGNTDIDIKAADTPGEIGEMAKVVVGFRDMMIDRTKLEDQTLEERKERRQRQEFIDRLINQFQLDVASNLESVTENMGAMRDTATQMNTLAESTSVRTNNAQDASQAASNNVQTVAAATEEFSASIQEIGRQLDQATTVVDTATQITEAANDKVSGLATAAQQIGDVVSLIQDIAEQTNLLALNATIEAARAGEMGRGFAVVASEVKELATQTSKATEEISQHISGIQSSTDEAVVAIQKIGATVEEVNTYTTSISHAVTEQEAATHEISQNLQEAATGTMAASEDLAGVAEAINETNASASKVETIAIEVAERTSGLDATIQDFLKKVAAA